MKITYLALLSLGSTFQLAAAAPVAGAIDTAPDGQHSVYLCEKENFQPPCKFIEVEKDAPYTSPYHHTGSFGPSEGTTCRWIQEIRGTSTVISNDVVYPGSGDLQWWAENMMRFDCKW